MEQEAIFRFNVLKQKHLHIQKDMYACFNNFAKAFDRVHHIEPINYLERTGIDGKDVRIICELYWHQKATIRIDQAISKSTETKRGVRQGCILYPRLSKFLQNLFLERHKK